MSFSFNASVATPIIIVLLHDSAVDATRRSLIRPGEELAAGIAKELQLEEEQLAVDKLTCVIVCHPRFGSGSLRCLNFIELYMFIFY